MFNVQPTRILTVVAEPLATPDDGADIDARYIVEHEVCGPDDADHHSVYFVNADGTSTWWCDCGTPEDADLIAELLEAHHSLASCGLEERGPHGAAHETEQTR